MINSILNPDVPRPLFALWAKYRPVVIHLMMASSEGPQQYKLYRHEFQALGIKDKAFAFILQAYKGKAMNDIRKSPIAQDLMNMLNMSRKASDQLEKYAFEFRLDTNYYMHVSRLQVQ